MKKRILFVGQSLKIGGIERALVDTINSLDEDEFEVDLFLFHNGGAYKSNIKRTVNIIKSNRFLDSLGRTNAEAKASVLSFVLRTSGLVLSKAIGNKTLYTIVFFFCKKLRGYDTAISFFNDIKWDGLYYGCNLFVIKKVDALRKYAWIHADYEKTNLNQNWNNSIYQSYEGIVNVSLAMKEKFDKLKIVPKNKSFIVYNPIDNKEILERSKDITPSLDDKTIVSVGRLEEAKGVKSLFEIAYSLQRNGFNFKWVFIGDGALREWCKSFIEEHSLQNVVFLLGHQNNPYPYIKNAFLYVSGSHYETFGLCIAESLILNTPVVALRYDAIGELIDGKNGIVVDDYKEMEEVISKILNERDEYSQLKNNTRLLMDYNSIHNRQITALLDK